MSKDAVCIRCGAWKRWPPEKCRSCGFKPSDDLDLAKSLYLSRARFDEADDETEHSTVLEQAATTLRNGGAIDYESAELQRLSERLRGFRSVSSGQVWGAVFRFFLPGLLFLAGLLGLLFLVRSAKG